MSENNQEEELMWQWFAEAHPHEAHAKWPDRFWTFFHTKQPGLNRDEMERILADTDEPAHDA